MRKNSCLGLVALAAATPLAMYGQNAINVQLSRTTSSSSIVTTENTPITFAGGAADTSDSGQYWNSLISPTVTFNNTSGAQVTNVVEQSLSLVDSQDNASSVSISSILFSENTGKNDTIHNTGLSAGTNPGSDGLSASPSSLMSQSWFNNGTSEFMIFNLTGLNAGGLYNLYIYGAGQTNGYGGTYTVPTANQAPGYNTAANAYSTEPSLGAIYRSVFDSTGVNPTPENGLTWVDLPVQADGSGDLSFYVLKDGLSGIKGSINGFQLQPITTPEPGTMALATFGALTGLTLFRRNRK